MAAEYSAVITGINCIFIFIFIFRWKWENISVICTRGACKYRWFCWWFWRGLALWASASVPGSSNDDHSTNQLCAIIFNNIHSDLTTSLFGENACKTRTKNLLYVWKYDDVSVSNMADMNVWPSVWCASNIYVHILVNLIFFFL